MAAISALLFAVGCSGGDDDKASPPSTPPPPSNQAPATPNPEEVARANALEVYGRFTAYQNTIASGTRLDDASLDRIATGRAAALIRQLASTTAKDGITIQGPTTRSTQIAVVSLTASVPQVMLEDCVDVSRRRAVNRDGTPAEIATQSPRFITAVTVTRDAAGWRVADVNAQRDRTC